MEKFKSTLSNLSQSASHWQSNVKQNGISEHMVYKAVLTQAVELLDAEKDYYDTHSQNFRSWKFKRRSFPSQLTYLLSNILEFVRASPEFSVKVLERQELLAKRFLMGPFSLPFGYDMKYVPIQETVDEVQRALENTQGQLVVTLYGAPGMGKSSLAKHVALHYQDAVKGSRACLFDGVRYLFS